MPRLHLGFNLRTFASDRLRGFSRHTHGLIRGLLSLPEKPEIVGFSDVPLATETYSELLSQIRLVSSRARPHLFWEQVLLPLQFRKQKIDVFHSTLNIGIPLKYFREVPRVITVHDLITHRELSVLRNLKSAKHIRAMGSFQASWAATKTADLVITVSEHTKRDIISEYPELEPRIKVIPNGVEEIFSPGNADPEVLNKFNLIKNGYYLYVGGFETRKNVLWLLERMVEFKRPILLVGNLHASGEELKRKFASVPWIQWAGYCPDGDLVSYYRGAKATIVPSRNEGFGFQVIEAMASGCPVLCSNATSLPEVAGGAAHLFSPSGDQGSKELLAGIERIEKDPQAVKELQLKARERVANLRWPAIARITYDCYLKLLS